jgi:iron complex transport system permease protein
MILLSVSVGARAIPLPDVLAALVAPSGSDDDVVIRDLRLPRTVVGVAVGVALGVAGGVIQGHTRNPLADPGLLGVSAGAAFAVCLAIFAFGVTSLAGYVWFAFGGALAASAGVFLLGRAGRGAAMPVTLALAGAAVTAFLGALTSAVVLLDADTLDAYRFWVVGSLAGRSLDVLAQVAPFLAVGLVLALANAPAVNAMSLGEDVARGLGQRVALAHLVGVASVTLLTGGSVAICGPIAFLGLVVPHLARAVTGPDYRRLLPYAALFGALLLLAADVVGRLVMPPAELQVGTVLAFVGAPFFIALVRRRRLVSL